MILDRKRKKEDGKDERGEKERKYVRKKETENADAHTSVHILDHIAAAPFTIAVTNG